MDELLDELDLDVPLLDDLDPEDLAELRLEDREPEDLALLEERDPEDLALLEDDREDDLAFDRLELPVLLVFVRLELPVLLDLVRLELPVLLVLEPEFEPLVERVEDRDPLLLTRLSFVVDLVLVPLEPCLVELPLRVVARVREPVRVVARVLDVVPLAPDLVLALSLSVLAVVPRAPPRDSVDRLFRLVSRVDLPPLVPANPVDRPSEPPLLAPLA